MLFRALSLVTLLLAAVSAPADDVLHPGTPQFDRPTLMALGIKLPITGDDNHNARVTVRYRRAGASAWKQALPLAAAAGIFARSIGGQLQAGALNADNSPNAPSAPARPGQTVQVFATGQGAVANPPAAGGPDRGVAGRAARAARQAWGYGILRA